MITLLLLLAQDVPIEVDSNEPGTHKVVLLAGGFSKGGGEHEYFAGSVVLFNLLKQSAGVRPVLAREFWPKNEAIFEGAKTIVFFMDGIGKQPTAQPDKLAKIEALAAKGVGIVHLHQVIDYPKDSGEKALPLLGGVWVPKVGTRGHWIDAFETFTEHPVTRGVTPFKIDDGYIYKNTFMPSGVTPLLRVKPPKGPPLKGMEDVVAWTYDRPGGGRSFVFTGAHLHASWGLEGFRRFVTNGILWSAGLEVPAGGAPVALDPEDLKKHLDVKPAAAKK
jgi:type 1 glutamine amidotransferase